MSYKDKIDNIEAICLFPKNFEESRKYYETVFGFEPKRIQNEGVDPTVENPNFIEYEFAGASFALWAKDATAEIMGDDNLKEHVVPANFMIAIKVDTPEDVDLVHKGLTENGVKCLSEPTNYHFGSRAAYYQDIEHNVWEIYTWLDGKDGPSLV